MGGCTSTEPLSLTHQLRVLLKTQAPLLLKFLCRVDSHVSLYWSEKVRSRAIQRYEQLWIPFCLAYGATGEVLVPPLDIHFAWYCHMLSPEQYRDDMRSLEVDPCLPHLFSEFLSLTEHERDGGSEREEESMSKRQTRRLWRQMFGADTPYELELEEEDRRVLETFSIAQGVAVTNYAHLAHHSVGDKNTTGGTNASSYSSSSTTLSGGNTTLNISPATSSTALAVSPNSAPTVSPHISFASSSTVAPMLSSKISADLHTLMRAQQWLFYQWQLPHYRLDPRFLDRAIDRYLQIFIDLCRLSPETRWIPPLDIQWIWHAHLSCHSEYILHSVALCGRIVTDIEALCTIDGDVRLANWKEMHLHIYARKWLSIRVDGSGCRGDATLAQLSTLLFQRLLREYEGYFPRDVRIAGSLGCGWSAHIERINCPRTPAVVGPPRVSITLPKRFAQMDNEDKVMEDQAFDRFEQQQFFETHGSSDRALQRINLRSPRVKRWSQWPGGLKSSVSMSRHAICIELYLKNELVASVHSLTSEQCSHFVFDECCRCTLRKRAKLNKSNVECAGQSSRVSDNEKDGVEGDDEEGDRCTVMLLRVAGLDQALLHGEWVSRQRVPSIAQPVDVSEISLSMPPVPLRVPTSTAETDVSNGIGIGIGIGSGVSALSSECLLSYPAVTLYSLGFNELMPVTVLPAFQEELIAQESSGEDSQQRLSAKIKRQVARPIFSLRSLSRALGQDNVDDHLLLDLQQAQLQGERNAPPVAGIALALAIAAYYVTLRPTGRDSAMEMDIDERGNPLLAAAGGLFPDEDDADADIESKREEDPLTPCASYAALLRRREHIDL